MSEPMPHFELLRPVSLAEAVAAHASRPGSRYLAGGTDLIVNMRRGLVEPDAVIDISAIAELGVLDAGRDGMTIGAGVTLARLARDAGIRACYPAIAEAAEAVAGPSHRTCATVGGNLCLDTRCLYYNQSHWWRKANGFCLKYQGDTCHVAPQGKRCRAAFSGDLAPALMVHDAEVAIAGPAGARRVPLEELYEDDGAAHLRLQPGEIVVSVRVSKAGWRSAYAKARVRDGIDFPLAGVAVAMRRDGVGGARVRVAVTGTDSRPLLLQGTDDPFPLPADEAALARLAKLVQKQVTPMRTTSTAAHYRRLAAAALARRLASRLAAEAPA